MNKIRAIQQLNKREIEHAIPPTASWHADYRDTAYVFVGGLPLDLSEGDVVTIFSQYGNPTHLNLIRDKETGKSKGFGFLKYEDQRSCDLAIDNLGGAEVLGRILSVDHTRYKKKDGEDEETYRIDKLEADADGAVNGNGKRASDTDDSGDERRKRTRRERPMLKEEKALEQLLTIQDGEEQDPMREYLIREKREEVERAKERERRHKHKHRHRHRDDRDRDDKESSHRHRRRESHEDAERSKRRHRSRSPDDEGQDRHRHRPRPRNGSVSDEREKISESRHRDESHDRGQVAGTKMKTREQGPDRHGSRRSD